ncbi:MAG: multicomponent Na+:H+ antiporter subunit G [Bermanella sp.]|jgi:multicomponent Na+:H+ antiporter subunit G|uniref:cation:proton antiporter n=1 Tax=Glaciecola sp. 33A TaxID=2057807 RepID=UPI000C328259|nr:monovalent cation/H(+) antiporter subunit G [Glaciecola sp. 33A]PKI02146.1 Na+/H+ antiporter subunit G [Glaciecola sp. 33A]
MNIVDIYTIVMTSGGLIFFIAGTIGLLRFPDAISRLHALTKADNLGLGLIVLGILPQVSSIFDAVQLLFIWFIVMLSGAASCFLIANIGSAANKLPSDLQNKGVNNEL